ncbi:MAG: OmpH family outer membrane protein [Burkholderiales bacterium]
MNRTILSALACAAMLSFAASPAGAQTPGLNRIGVVNPDRILSESVPALRAQERIKAEFAKREGELAGMASQLQRLQAELERDGITMAQLDRQRKERAFNDLNQEFQKKKRSFEEDLEERRNTAMQEVSEQADRVIRQVAQQEKFDIIMREAVFASPRVDITDKVIEALAGGAKPAAKK